MPGRFSVQIVPELQAELGSNKLRGLRKRIERKLLELEENADMLGIASAPPWPGADA